MSLRIEDTWVWDFWFAIDGADYHIFYLQAQKSLGDERLRHVNATVGHAVSSDLRNWEVLPDAFGPAAEGAWDDRAIWTGSVIPHGGQWHFFYTACSTQDDALVQRIGHAVSDDLTSWERTGPKPILEADPTWYELLDVEAWHDQAWRDPWVLADPDGEGFHALITGRTKHGAPDGRGVIAHATSVDLSEWTVRPPLTEPGEFGQLEVAQVEVVDGSAVLLFSCGASEISRQRVERTGVDDFTGTYAVTGPSVLGPFDVEEAMPLDYSGLYSCRIIPGPDGNWQLLGFVNYVDGEFVGEISDPIPFALPPRV